MSLLKLYKNLETASKGVQEAASEGSLYALFNAVVNLDYALKENETSLKEDGYREDDPSGISQSPNEVYKRGYVQALNDVAIINSMESDRIGVTRETIETHGWLEIRDANLRLAGKEGEE